MPTILSAPTGTGTGIMPAGTWLDGGEGQHVDWTVTPLASGTASFDTAPTESAGPNPASDTLLRVTHGTDVWSDDDSSTAGGARSRVTFPVTAGLTYTIEVSLYPGSAKSARLGVTYTGPATAAPNAGPSVVVAPTTTTLPVTWTPAPGTTPDGYTIALDGGATLDVGTELAHTFTDLAPGTPHTVTVGTYTTVTSPAVSSVVATVTAAAPSGYWRLDELAGTTAADTSGNGHPGTHENGVQVARPSLLAGSDGAAAAYPGGARTRVPAGAWINTPHLSVVATIKPANFNTEHMIMARDDEGRRVFQFRTSGSKLQLIYWTTTDIAVMSPVGDLVAGTTYDVGWTFDGTTARVYLNGVQVGTYGTGGALKSDTIDLELGAYKNGNNSFDGVLDEVATFPTALPPAFFADYHTARTTPPVGEDVTYVYGPTTTVNTATLAPPSTTVPDPRWWTHRLAAQLGLDGVDAQPVVELRRWANGVWVLDEQLSRALTGYRITYARKDAAGRTPPMAATLSLITARAGLLPIGTRLQLALSAAVCERLGLELEDGVRWTGEVTDPTVDYDGRLTTLTCVGRLGRTNRQTIDTTSWPRAHADALVPMITTAARTGMATALVEPGGGILQPPGVTTAGTLLDALVDSTGGQLVEQPAGYLDWHGPDHRRGMVPRMTLTAAAVLRRITWSQSVSDLVNVVDVGWGDGQKAIVEDTSSSDPSSGYGPYTASVDTLLVTESDAYDLGMLVVGRRATPVWRLPDLTVAPDVMHAAGHLPTADLATLLSLRHGERLSVAGLPDGCPIPAGVILEGWEETATPRAWRITLSVSDPKQSGVSLRWVDIDPDVAWPDIHPAVRWLDIARMETSDELLSPPT